MSLNSNIFEVNKCNSHSLLSSESVSNENNCEWKRSKELMCSIIIIVRGSTSANRYLFYLMGISCALFAFSIIHRMCAKTKRRQGGDMGAHFRRLVYFKTRYVLERTAGSFHFSFLFFFFLLLNNS